MKSARETITFPERQHPKWALDGRFARLSCGYVLDDDNAFPEAPHFKIGADGWIPESEVDYEKHKN